MKQGNFLAVLTILVATISGVFTSNVSCTARGSGLAGGIPLSNTSFVIYLFGDTSTVFSGFAANISVWLTSQQSNLDLEPHLYQYLPSIVDNNDGSYTVTYAVIAYGTFFLHVNFNSIGIKNSPFRAEFTAAQYPCAYDCNDHGLCHANGSCLCYPGYTTNTCSIAVVPTCYQAQISPCGTSMFLYFMPAVNTSVSTASCQYIVDVESLTKLGSNPLCIWKNATTLNTVFGSGATMMPGDTIIVSSPTTNSQSASLAETSLVVVESPLTGTAVAPVSVISAPSTHNPCSDLVLDATSSYNSGGRTMLYAWGVYSSSTVDVIRNFLSTVTTSVAVIPFKYTSQVGFGHDLIFILNITNYLGITTTASVPVRFSGIQTIDVRVTPAIIYVDAGQAVDIAGLVSFPSGECSGVQPLKKIKYSWIRKSGPLIELGDATNARLLHINKGVLAPGQLYEFELLVSSEVASGAAVAVVHVAEPAPFIYIVGGTRLFPFGEDLFLQAEVIVNGNNASLARIVWSVMDIVSKITVAKDLESFGSITIAASLFYPGKFRVVASLMTASDNLVAEDAVEIHITESLETPIVFIKAPFIVPAGEHLILSAVVASHTQEFTYVWASPQLDLQNREHSITPYNSQLLVVNSASLAFGSTMTFSVIAVSNKTQQIGWAQVEVVVGNALSSGACSLGSSGLAFRDTFGLACLGWETTDHPLTVKTWRQFEDSTKIPLQLTHGPISSVDFVLPAGAHTILANIQDSAGNSLWISLNTSAAYSTYDQSVLSQNPMLLVNSLLAEMQMNIGNYDVLIQNLPGIIDVLNFASAIANPASNTARINARETICNMSVGLLQAKEYISGLVSYMLTQIAVFPSELSNTALLQMRQYMETIAAPSFYLDRSSLQLHLKAIYSYILAELDNGAVSPVLSVATTALNALSQASLMSVFPAQDPFILYHNGLQLCVAKGISAGNLTAAGVSIFVSNQWELSIVSWPFNLYPDTSVSTIVKVITYNDNTPNPANADIVLPLLRNVADINDTIVECNAWNATTMSWYNNTCKLINISPIVCRCVLFRPTTVVSAFVYSGGSNVIAIPPDTLDIVKFSMLSEYQWAIIIGVGMTAVATLIGAVALAGKRSRYTNSFIRLRAYNGVLRMDSEEPDVTIEDLSTITDDLSDTGSNFEGDSTQSEEEVTLSEAEELGKAPNSTRLSRMGVQEGATGYVVSSTTLRNTVETDYDLEMKENIGPIKGTALRIRAHSIDMSQNIPGTPPPNPPNFNTASRVSLTAARAKLSAPSISRSALGFTRGDSLRAIPTTWKAPQN